MQLISAKKLPKVVDVDQNNTIDPTQAYNGSQGILGDQLIRVDATLKSA